MDMKKILVAMSILTVLSSCININIKGKAVRCKGPVVEKTFDLKDFNAIKVYGQADLILTQADSFSVVATANEDAFEYLDYKVEDSVLFLSTKDNVTLMAEENKVAVSLPELISLTVNGAADVDLKGAYKSDKDLRVLVNGAGDFSLSGIAVPDLNIKVNGAGDINAKGLDVESLEVKVNGAGDVILAGKAGKANFSVNGAGDVDASELDCDEIEKHCAGLASIKTKN